MLVNADAQLLAQAMWDALGTLGFDLDGDPNPGPAIAGSGLDGFIKGFLRDIEQMRQDYDEACDEAVEAEAQGFHRGLREASAIVAERASASIPADSKLLLASAAINRVAATNQASVITAQTEG